MRGRAGLIVLTLALAFALAAGPAAAQPSHAGRWITDAHGRVLIVHGLNMVYKRPPYSPAATGFGADDAAFLRASGFNAVRVGLIYKAVEPQPGVYDDRYLDSIVQTVDALGAQGIYSVLDFHQDLYNERFHGEGWPDWAVQDNGLPNQPNAGFPGNYIAMPALDRAFDNFWGNSRGPGGPGLQDRYAAAWRHVAERFRGNANVLGYELLNEPWPGSVWPTCANTQGCPVFDQATLAPFIERTMAAIRQADPSTLVWFEPNVLFNFGANTNLPRFNDKSTGFAFHDYCVAAQNGGGEPQPVCDPSEDLPFTNAVSHVAATGDALMLTEFGASDDAGVLQRMEDRADRNMVPWLEWAYCGCEDPTGSSPPSVEALVLDPHQPPTGSNVKSAKLRVLARPYPQAIAGTPQSYSFDPSNGSFDLTYSTARADGSGRFPAGSTTEVRLPPVQYPHGYSVTVSGARVTSGCGADVLTLASLAGSQSVSVRVKPSTCP
jgi:endoglycosylceramidase